MAREPQTRPQQTATALASPLQKRSQYLAQALAEMSKEPQRIAGYGDLGARLLAQAITQSASEKTDRALGAEAANADLARRRAIASGLGIEVPGEMQEVGSGRLGNPIAPILRAGRNLFGGGDAAQPAPAASNAAPMPPASQFNAPMAPVPPVENGGPLPPVSMMGQEPPQAMAQDPRLGPAPAQPAAMPQQQAGPPPQLVQQVERLLAQGTPEAYAQAEAIVQDYQQREMILASLTPEQRANPNFVYAALNNPDELGGNIAKQFAPTSLAAGSVGVVFGDDRRVGVPSFDEFGDSVVSRDPLTGRVETVATRGPTIAENLKAEELRQPRPLVVGQGGAVASFNTTTGETEIEVEREAADKPLSNAEQQAIENLELDLTFGDQALGNVRAVIADIDSGAFRLDPVSRAAYDLRNNTGQSSPQSLAFARAQTTVSNLRNTLLRENKGTQTEGDAIRILEEVIANWGDERVVRQGLAQFDRLYGQIQRDRTDQLDRRRSGESRRVGGGQSSQRPLSPEEASRLPPGTPFIGLDGVPRVRQ
jgi:hypothetical protein